MDKRLTAVHDYIHAEMEKQHIPGLALGIWVQGEPVLLQGYGYANLEQQTPATPDTVFEIASITKLFTATAVMMLAQAGKLALSDCISHYLPDLPQAWQAITIRHILTHSSGLKGYTETPRYWETTRLDISPAAILDLVRDEPLLFPSGQRYHYDNTGFYLLGLLLEQVSGKPYGDLLDELIFTPLGMADTRVNDPYAIVPRRAAGYSLQNGVLCNKAYYSTAGTFSAGVLLSTVNDMAKWDAALSTERLLETAVLQQMWTPQPTEQKNERLLGFSVGLGWFLVDHEDTFFAGHNGGIIGFASAYLRFLREGISAVLFCNRGEVPEPHKLALAAVAVYRHQ
ncbi:MAG: beta-lactamase family protein [Anaerolineales bacterium]|nr:beta-lactamase family protein [Anaerolineales bacterium]